jgi:acylphosphatase
MGLDGWVTNLWDGRVEVVIAGSKADVEAIVEWCRNGGIPFAWISDVEMEDERLSVEEGFDVR